VYISASATHYPVKLLAVYYLSGKIRLHPCGDSGVIRANWRIKNRKIVKSPDNINHYSNGPAQIRSRSNDYRLAADRYDELFAHLFDGVETVGARGA